MAWREELSGTLSVAAGNDKGPPVRLHNHSAYILWLELPKEQKLDSPRDTQPQTKPSVCPICTGDMGFRATHSSIGQSVIYVCMRCHSYFLHPPFSVEYTGSDWTAERKKGWDADVQRGRRHAPKILEMAGKIIGRPVRNVLEIGCGSAFMGVGFEEAGCAYTGVEIDETLIAFARSKGLRIVQSTAEDLSSSPLAGEKFDLILSSNTFEHLQRPRQAFAQLPDMTAGVIVMIVPNPHGFFNRLKANPLFLRLVQRYLGNKRAMAYSIDGYWHNIAYHRSTLRWLADDAGIQVQTIRGVNTNDRVLGFVQPNTDPIFRVLSYLALRLGMANQLLLIGRPESNVRDTRNTP